MDDESLPDMEQFCTELAEMHQIARSPDGKFGFHITTHNGTLAQDNRWTDTWEEYFVQNMRRMLELEMEVQGPQSEEMRVVVDLLFEKVIPRLLRPMETGGHRVEPSLVHGDMWHGNTCTDKVSKKPVVFDACAFWGHNECMYGSISYKLVGYEEPDFLLLTKEFRRHSYNATNLPIYVRSNMATGLSLTLRASVSCRRFRPSERSLPSVRNFNHIHF